MLCHSVRVHRLVLNTQSRARLVFCFSNDITLVTLCALLASFMAGKDVKIRTHLFHLSHFCIPNGRRLGNVSSFG
jgi:hypothetical protein